MKKLPLGTLTFVLLATTLLTSPAIAEPPPPEELFQLAKKQCPEKATTPEGWADIRKCIAKKKKEILLQDPRTAKACEKYIGGAEHDQCIDWYYVKGPSASTYTNMRYKAYLQDNCAGIGCLGGGYPGERQEPSTARENTPGGVIGGRNTSPGRSNRKKDQSDITGIGGSTPAVSGGRGGRGGGRNLNGIGLPTVTEGRDGNLRDLESDVKRLRDSIY
jgi:hypothetical protein